jgi:hypothetical protein
MVISKVEQKAAVHQERRIFFRHAAMQNGEDEQCLDYVMFVEHAAG